MTPSVRAVVLTGYLEVARHVGLDPYTMLRRFRISPDKLEEPENRLPAATVIKLLEASASDSGCQDFGLRMAQCRTFASLGPVSLLLEHLSSMREVVHEVSQHRRHFNDILVLGIDKLEGTELLKIELLAKFAEPQACMLTVAVAQTALVGASWGVWRPHVVHFTHPAPKDVSRINGFFMAPVQFGLNLMGSPRPTRR